MNGEDFWGEIVLNYFFDGARLRPISVLLSLALAASMLVLGGVQAATATTLTERSAAPTETIQLDNPALASQPQLAISGTVVVTAVDQKSNSRTEYSVATDKGLVRIAGKLSRLTSGSSFTGTVALPASLTNRASRRSLSNMKSASGTPVDSRGTAGTEFMQLAQTEPEPLQVVTASSSYAQSTFGTAAHTVDVAVINGASFSDANVDTNVSGLNTFWVSQTGGAITGLTRPNAVVRYTSSYLASCNFNAMWDEAAKKFLGGSASASSYFTLSGRHLIVVVDQSYSSANCGTGIGSVGGSSNGGGLIWANMAGPTDLHTLAHEFGHNLGLGHANIHQCDSDSQVEGTTAQGCKDFEYEDLYDVMSLAFDAGGYGNTNQLAALNITDKVRLGVLAPGDIATVSGGAATVNLAPASDANGVRGIKATDPQTGDVYYVEYRSGTGMDSGAFYTKSFSSGAPQILADMRPGVRILRLRPAAGGSAASVALAMLKQSGDSVKMLAMKVGGTFVTTSGALSIKFSGTSGGNAIVSIGNSVAPMTIDRVSGSNRYATAVAVSKAAYPTGAPVVYIAQGANYPDALGAAPAAVKEGGPLLLTDSNSLISEVKAEIERLNPSKIVVVGGTGVIKPAVFSALKSMVGNTIRVGGADRYETARLVVQQAFGSSTVAYVATGSGFPDALSASAAAGSEGAPVILINGSASSVDNATKALIRSLGVKTIKIAGGTAVVTTGAAKSLATVATVTRSAGTNRFDTNHLVNSQIFADSSRVFLATGFQFPDALAGSAIAGAQGAPLYLVQTACIPAQTRSDIIAGNAKHVTLVGGTGVLTDSVKKFTGC